MSTYATLTPHNGHDVSVRLHATTGVVTLWCATCSEPVMHAGRGDNLPARYHVTFRFDTDGVDVGDWLPQDEEHYNRVGPFQVEKHTDGTPCAGVTCAFRNDGGHQTSMQDATWQEWWARPESHVSNWESYGMVLLAWCDTCEQFTDTGQAIWGLDFYSLGDDWMPGDGLRLSVDDESITSNTWLHEHAKDLIAEYEHRRNTA